MFYFALKVEFVYCLSTVVKVGVWRPIGLGSWRNLHTTIHETSSMEQGNPKVDLSLFPWHGFLKQLCMFWLNIVSLIVVRNIEEIYDFFLLPDICVLRVYQI